MSPNSPGLVPAALARRVLDQIESESVHIVEHLQRYVRTRSINPRLDPDSSGEAAMTAAVTSDWEALGLTVETGAAEPGRPNVIATWRGAGGGPRLMFNAHLDTVTATEETEWLDPETGETLTAWSVDPFSAEVRDGVMIGRGSADHKSPIVALMAAVRAIQAAGARLSGDLVAIHDVDEETGGKAGMAFLAANGYVKADAAVYACTSDVTPLAQGYFSALKGNNVVRALNGRQVVKVTIRGHNYHQLTPKTGITAIERLLRIAPALQAYMDEVNRVVDPLTGTGAPVIRAMNVKTRAKAESRAADVAELLVLRRIFPQQDPARVFTEFVSFLEGLREELTAELVVNIPPYELAADHPLVRAMANGCRAVRGDANITGMPAVVGISRMLERLNLPTVLFGYGCVNFHHAIDERIAVRDVIDTAKVYALAILEYCGVAG